MKLANWAGYEEAINLPNLGFLLSPTQACRLMEQGFLKAGNSFVGMSSGRSGNSSTKCYWSEDCALAVKQKRQAYRVFCRHPNNLENWIQYKKTQAKA